jgi:hypothetical protein
VPDLADKCAPSHLTCSPAAGWAAEPRASRCAPSKLLLQVQVMVGKTPCAARQSGNDTRSVLGMGRWGCSTVHATCGHPRGNSEPQDRCCYNTLDHTQPGVGHKECQSHTCLLLHALHVSQYLVTSPAACLPRVLPPLLPRRPCRSCCRRL